MDLSWRPVALAVELARQDLPFVVVGGTARRLLGREHQPTDLDIVVSNPAAAVESAARLGALPRPVRGTPTRFNTCFGPLDVFVGHVQTTTRRQVDGVWLIVDGAA